MKIAKQHHFLPLNNELNNGIAAFPMVSVRRGTMAHAIPKGRCQEQRNFMIRYMLGPTQLNSFRKKETRVLSQFKNFPKSDAILSWTLLAYRCCFCRSFLDSASKVMSSSNQKYFLQSTLHQCFRLWLLFLIRPQEL